MEREYCIPNEQYAQNNPQNLLEALKQKFNSQTVSENIPLELDTYVPPPPPPIAKPQNQVTDSFETISTEEDLIDQTIIPSNAKTDLEAIVKRKLVALHVDKIDLNSFTITQLITLLSLLDQLHNSIDTEQKNQKCCEIM